jgi:hypothetical protein
VVPPAFIDAEEPFDNTGFDSFRLAPKRRQIDLGVMSPLLKSLVIDTDSEQQGFEVIGFADDLVIIIRGKVELVLNKRRDTSLNYATE